MFLSYDSQDLSVLSVQSVVKKKLPEDRGISVFVQLTQDFPGERKNGGEQLANRKNRENLCSI